LINVASKIISKVIVMRLQKCYEKVGQDEQCGFRPERGTIDGLFNTMMALQKRKSYGLPTYGLFIDLVKAFDSISRDALFAILRRYGVPDHFLNIVIRLHKGATFSIDVNGEEVVVENNIGVRQGSNEGPVLFLFFMLAIMETMVWPSAIVVPQYCSREAGPICHFQHIFRQRYGNATFEHYLSLFADDAAFSFDSYEDLVIGLKYLYHHLKSFGVDMHVGRNGQKSKTVAVFFPVGDEPGVTDTVTFLDENNVECSIHFEDKMKYLGSYLSSAGTSEVDVNARISKAAQAFGALTKRITRSKEMDSLKGAIYVALVLNVLLYGCECWTLNAVMKEKLNVFHRRCVRRMCRVTTLTMSSQQIHHDTLFKRLGIHPLNHYYHSRVLRWAGHLARMPMSRRPRLFLTSGIYDRDHSQHLTWARTVNEVLQAKNISTTFDEWRKLAEDRDQWREMIREIAEPSEDGGEDANDANHQV